MCSSDLYGSKVFNEHVMKERLPSATYKSLEKTLHRGAPLDIEVANVVASVMKRWAMELGASMVAIPGGVLLVLLCHREIAATGDQNRGHPGINHIAFIQIFRKNCSVIGRYPLPPFARSSVEYGLHAGLSINTSAP